MKFKFRVEVGYLLLLLLMKKLKKLRIKLLMKINILLILNSAGMSFDERLKQASLVIKSALDIMLQNSK